MSNNINSQIDNQIQFIKLKRIQQLNTRLIKTLQRERIPASKASELIINFVEETPDYLIPYNWKLPPEQNKFARYQHFRSLNRASRQHVNTNCCIIM